MRLRDALHHIVTDEERKSFLQMGLEALHCAWLEREFPIYYFTSLLYQRGSDDYRHFIGHRTLQRIIREFFLKGDTSVLEDKSKFSNILERYGIEAPKLLGRSRGYEVSVRSQRGRVENISQFAEIIREIIDASLNGVIFVKPVDGFGGQSTFKLSGVVSETNLYPLYESMASTDFLFQEYLTQHESINSIYGESLNTLRVHAYVDPDDQQVHILSALMRFGAGGNIVDNATSAGFFIPVDLETWALQGKGKSFLHSGARTFEYHPDSGVRLDGFELPYGEESKALIRRVAPLFDKPVVGWDIGLSDRGPIVIEGNHMPHLIMAQIAGGGIKAHPGFTKVFASFL